jgi:hypothetical protein
VLGLRYGLLMAASSEQQAARLVRRMNYFTVRACPALSGSQRIGESLPLLRFALRLVLMTAELLQACKGLRCVKAAAATL